MAERSSTFREPRPHLRSTLKRPEILAPVGTREMLAAAIENGADAVYFGVQTMNARLRAENFAEDDLPELMQQMHCRGVRGYLTLNTLVFSDEVREAERILRAASRAGVDAVIVQDLGLAHLAQTIVPDLEIHASTQMTITCHESLAALEQLGLRFPRAVLARELSRREIGRMLKDGATTELEVFVHGALCVAYSGQCLTSEALGGRSANRGECAQACRLPYDLVVDESVRDLNGHRYLLSPQDLAAYDDLPDLMALGVASIKIEGRLKSPEYVAATVRAYRAAIDRAANGTGDGGSLISKGELRALEATFSRGFTRGYLHDVDHQSVVEGRSSTKRGTCLGRVVGANARHVRVSLEAELRTGDGVVIEGSDAPDREAGGRVARLSMLDTRRQATQVTAAAPGDVVEIELWESGAPLRSVRPGQRVFKTSDPVIEKELRQSFIGGRPKFRRPIDIDVHGRAGEPLRLRITDERGLLVEVAGTHPCEPAKDRALDHDTLAQQLGRLGDTPFKLRKLRLHLDRALYVPISHLNTLRRDAVAALLRARAEAPSRREVTITAEDIRESLRRRADAPTTAASADRRLTVLCRTLEQVEGALAAGARTVYTDFEDLRLHREARRLTADASAALIPATLRVVKPGEAAAIRKILAAEPDAILVRNLASWHVLREAAPSLPLVGDHSLNVSNDISAHLLLAAGLERITPSYDLNFDQLRELLQMADAQRFEVTVHQHMPMFHMEHCVFCRFLSDGTDSSNCGRPCEKHEVRLRDRMGYEHPVKADFGCRNTVFNAVPQSAAAYLGLLCDLGVRSFRIELLLEDATAASQTIRIYEGAIRGFDEDPHPSDRSLWETLRASSKLGVTRGSLDHIGGAEKRIAKREEKLYGIGARELKRTSHDRV